MKKLYLLVALALAGAGCQQQAPPTRAGVEKKIEATASVARASVPEQPLLTLFTAADTLTAPMRALLRQYDLSPLWQSDVEYRRERPTLDGFFGPDHYRFSLVFSQVQRDEQRPDTYHVRGKCRYRKNIRPFTGVLTIRQLKDLPRGAFFLGGAGSDLPDTAAAQTYTALAQVQLTEENRENSGIFEGEAALDFYVVPAPVKIAYVTGNGGIELDMPARGAGLLLRGSRRNQTTRQVKKFVVSSDVFAAAPDVYKDFGIGDRGGEINPKYAKLGWTELWENDEWWADSPTAQL